MKKRGQVTIFIILGIVIVGAIMLLLFIPKKIVKPPEINVNKVYSYIQNLIENEAFKCIQQIGKQGGYYKIPKEVYINKTAYWYYEGINTQPFLNIIEDQTEECINKVLKRSTQKTLEIFGNYSLNISEDMINSKVVISEGITTIDVDYPIAISKGQTTSLISDFGVHYTFNLLKLYELATGIVNYVSLPEFDKCNPSKNCYGEEINFSFFNEGENLFIKGQTFALFSNKSKAPYELRFAIKRHIKEAFGENKKHLAVLYQEDTNLPTFGEKSIKLLSETLEIEEGIDFYGCEGISSFFERIDKYDVVIITGNLQFQIVLHTFFDTVQDKEVEEGSNLPGGEEGELLLYGCNSFNPSKRKVALKNWVNNGGILWINNVAKAESDNFVVSYLGSLGYKGGKWENLGIVLTLEALQNSILNILNKHKNKIDSYDITAVDHPILSCPNDIIQELEGTDYFYSLKVTKADEVLIGDRNSAKLWTRKLGKGIIVFDEFILKDNLYESLEFNDLYSKEIAEKYFVNVLNYLAKFEEYKKAELEISLISPLGDEEIEYPLFYFQSQFGKNTSYNMLITDKSGTTKSLKFENSELKEEGISRNRFKVDLTNKSIWTELNEERYEWQIKMNEYFSDIGSFMKKIPTEINERHEVIK